MVFVMPHITVLIGAGALGVAFIFQIIGLAAPGWIVASNASLGLWKFCRGGSCVEIFESDFEKACQAFGILGVLAMGAALACVLLVCFTQTALFLLLAIAATAAGALFAMIEFAVYAGETPNSLDHLGYSFALTVVAFILCFITVGLFLIARKKTTGCN